MSGSKDLILVGTQSLSEMVIEIATILEYNIIGYVDDFSDKVEHQGLPVIGSVDNLLANDKFFGNNVFVAIGDNIGRKKVMERFKESEFNLPNLIHPKAEVSKSIDTFGSNNLIFPFVYVGIKSSIGSGNIFFSGVRINHHNTIGDYNFFAPNVSLGGHTTLGNCNKFGMNSVINPYLNFSDSNNLKPLELLK